jgi:hypothetical protein
VVTVLGLSSDGFGAVSAGDVGGVEGVLSEDVSEDAVEDGAESVFSVSEAGVVVSGLSDVVSDVVEAAEVASAT